jgi:hypothetical protein
MSNDYYRTLMTPEERGIALNNMLREIKQESTHENCDKNPYTCYECATSISEKRLASGDHFGYGYWSEVAKTVNTPLRCEITGNPCGSDTWKADETCECPNCRKYCGSNG